LIKLLYLSQESWGLDFAICLYEFPIDLGTVLIVGVVYCVFHFIVPLYN